MITETDRREPACGGHVFSSRGYIPAEVFYMVLGSEPAG